MLTRTCGFVGLGFASSFGFDSQWPNNNDKTQPDQPDSLPEQFRKEQGSWLQSWKTDVRSCQYPGGIGDGCPGPQAYGSSSDWVDCGFANLMKIHSSRLVDLPSPKPQPEIAGPVQTINGLELGIRYAHFCNEDYSGEDIYQAAYISPYHDITQWAFKGQHYLDWVPLERFLSNTEFDLVGNETERKTLVDGMRQLGLRDDGIIGQEQGGSTRAPCLQSGGTCSAALPEPYSCTVDPPVQSKPTGCGRGGTHYCPGSCLNQETYQQQCAWRHCGNSGCCHITMGANETVSISQVWYTTTNDWQANTLLV